MTRLAGDFETDLPLPAALEACVEGLHGLGWHIEDVGTNRVVSYADAGGTDGPPRIEVELRETKEGTDLRLIGEDSDAHPLEAGELGAVLDRARDAIAAAVENEASGETAPAGWYDDPYDTDGERYWDGSEWTDRSRERAGDA